MNKMTREYSKTELEEILKQSNKQLIQLKEDAERRQKEEDLKSGLQEVGLANDQYLITKKDAFEVMRDRYDFPDNVTNKELEQIMNNSQKELENNKHQLTKKEIVYELGKSFSKESIKLGVKALSPMLGLLSGETRQDIQKYFGRQTYDVVDSFHQSEIVDALINIAAFSSIGYFGTQELLNYATFLDIPSSLKVEAPYMLAITGLMIGMTFHNSRFKTHYDLLGNPLITLIESPVKAVCKSVYNVYNNAIKNLNKKN